MELPFAVESATDPPAVTSRPVLNESDSSLVTASSQGSFMNSSGLDSPLLPNTPQDVVLPRYENIPYTATQTGVPHQLQRPDPHHFGGNVVRHEPPDNYGEPEVIDFTYVDVCETDADEMDLLIDGNGTDMQEERQRGDILAVLLSGINHDGNESLMGQMESANESALKASEAKKQGDLIAALEYHSKAANSYKDNAMTVRDRNLANSLLLLSQTQAKSALALKGIVKMNPAELRQVLPSSSGGDESTSTCTSGTTITHKDRLRAAVRGALGSHHPHEEDITDSQFLGRATLDPVSNAVATDTVVNDDSRNDSERGTLLSEGQESSHNPVDEMMELERELRDMDMALELGNSISSLDARMQNRMKNSMVDGSFMVVPPGSNSYMSSSIWGSSHIPTPSRQQPGGAGTAGVRARANRVQNILGASAVPTGRHVHPPQPAPSTSKSPSGLESSWWGNASTTSQVLTSSVISLGSRAGADIGHVGEGQGGQPAHTKQLMRLMDSLKTLGDENASLLREVEEAEAARAEAKAAREQMKRFKAEYGKRFSSLKAALEKFRQEHPQGKDSSVNPVNTSEFIRTASVSDQLQRQEQLIRKLTADLKKEKEESKKKDAALRKYESFYREVKQRSAAKAAMKTQQQRQHKPSSRQTSSRIHR